PASCSSDAANASRSTWRIVGSVAGCGLPVGASHLELGARLATNLVGVPADAIRTPGLRQPFGDRLAHPRMAALDHRRGVVGGDERGFHHDALRVRDLHPALPVDRARDLAAHAPSEVGCSGLHLVARPSPTGAPAPGLLLPLASEAVEHRSVLGVDDAAGRAPVLVAAPPLVADE